MAKPEYEVAKALSTYIKLKYPKVEYHMDLAGNHMTKAQAGMNKALQKRRGFADLQIMEPRSGYHGAFIELKADGVKLHKKGGSFTSDHIHEQYTFLQLMRERGYFAEFAVGLDDAIKMVDWYLNQGT